jgi:hypothetical protein
VADAGLRFFKGLERFQDQLEFSVAIRARFEMLSHSVKRSVDRLAVEDPLSVLVQLVEAFRAGQFNILRLPNHLQQPVDVFGA